MNRSRSGRHSQCRVRVIGSRASRVTAVDFRFNPGGPMPSEHDNCGEKHALPPDLMTQPCTLFFQQHMRLDRFHDYVVSVAADLDDRARQHASVFVQLREALPDDVELHPTPSMERMATDGVGAVKALARFSDLLLEMMISRAIDNFLTYISEMLGLLFKTRPETLRSGETVRLDMVLKHATMEDLISDLTDRKVNELSYQGMRDLSAYLEHLGFRLFTTTEDMERAIRLIELRNIIVHNRRIVNSLFLGRVSQSPCQLGERYRLDSLSVHSDIEFLARSAADIDERASAKFGLPQPFDHMAEHARLRALHGRQKTSSAPLADPKAEHSGTHQDGR